ncbi:elongation factor P--(R)-beta-lysine ligase [Thalassotalea agariperforans]
MMNWQASMSWQTAQKRAQVYSMIRTFFNDRNVVEVETPLMSQGTISDLHLDAFSTKYNFLSSGVGQTLYLQTSPEFAMKRLLASGYGDIYQLCKAFRDEPYGRFHNPEFSILEWYRLGFSHHDLMAEVETLLISTLSCLPAEYVSYQNVFQEYTGIDPLSTTIVELKAYLRRNEKFSDWLVDVEDIDTLLQFTFAECIEQHIGKNSPCFVYGFPASQACLAKINREDARVADRFECYYQGIELANGFSELTDAETQLERFKQDNIKRVAHGKTESPIDDRFIMALAQGLPECSGVALGIDRLLMLATGETNIKKVITFGVNRA